MWALKLLEYVLSAGSLIYSAWQRVRQKQAIIAEIKLEQEKSDDKAVKEAQAIRDKLTDDGNLLLEPDQRGHNHD